MTIYEAQEHHSRVEAMQERQWGQRAGRDNARHTEEDEQAVKQWWKEMKAKGYIDFDIE